MTGRRKYSGEDHSNKQSPGTIQSPGQGRNGSSPRPKRILIVDEDLLSVVDISQTLIPKGYVFSHATEKGEAMKVLKNERPDLIICTVDDRRPDRLQLAQEMQRARDAGNIPFLFVLGSKRDSAQAPQILGPKQYLTKPFTREQLSLAVQEHLKQKADRSVG